jgi:predicted MPP superfamily phosphohydrolase
MKQLQFKVFLLILVFDSLASAQKFRSYIAQLNDSSFTLAWGSTEGTSKNTIGRAAQSQGAAVLQVAGRSYSTNQSWYQMTGLSPDTNYKYELKLNGQFIASGTVRTWPRKTQSLTFFVIGDWGNGSKTQFRIAARMEEERQRLAQTNSPVRFVISTGDNIYKGGSRDRDWEQKFFAPYQDTLKAIPFYAVLGNHDGNESEASADLPASLDNFFSPAGQMTRWYHFQYGGFAEFFALDSTTNQHPSATSPAYLEAGEQSQWLKRQLANKPLDWRIAIMHHPIFTAGPNHPPAMPKLRHWFEDFRKNGVSAIFAGHEHNLQISERNPASGNMQFVVSGAGGELRSSSVRKQMKSRNIAGWAAQAHFLLVQIEGESMTILPFGTNPINLQNQSGGSIPLPIRVPRRVN